MPSSPEPLPCQARHLDLSPKGGPARARPRVLFIANRPARDTTSGPLLMHRHLRHVEPRFEIVRAHPCEPLPDDAPFVRLPVSRTFLRAMSRPATARWSRALDLLFGWAIPRRALHALVDRERPDLLLTVAESPLLRPLTSVAKALRLPLVTMVHDWSPVWENVPERLRPLVERRFSADCRAATLSLCISEEIAQRLGGGPRMQVLPPVPDDKPDAPNSGASPFHALYAGVFHHFQGLEIAGLCSELSRRSRPDLLRLFGPEPDRDDAIMAPVKAGGFYRGLLPRAAMRKAFGEAGALLVVCPFAARLDAFARYSFPSKLTEYLQHGLPIVLWAPPHAAATSWALRHDAALVIRDASPIPVADALARLEADGDLRRRLAENSARNASIFSPENLHRIFENSLWNALQSSAAKRY